MRKHKNIALAAFDKKADNKNRIHFLNTSFSDAILLESEGKFALIDCAEDNDNPRGFKELDYIGYEDRVLEYLKENAADENGRVYLDFIVGTHSHSDHIGGFDTIISDESISIGRAYLKKYDESRIVDYEVNKWDNKEVYNQMVNALNDKSIPIISKPDGVPFTLGNFKITLYNTEDNDKRKVGENDNSLGLLVEKNSTRIFLAGDINNINKDEKRLAPLIGRVNCLKVGHHSYAGSTSSVWLRKLKPEVCIVTNDYKTADKITLRRIRRIAKSDIFLTGEENGIVAVIDDNGKINYYNDIHK